MLSKLTLILCKALSVLIELCLHVWSTRTSGKSRRWHAKSLSRHHQMTRSKSGDGPTLELGGREEEQEPQKCVVQKDRQPWSVWRRPAVSRMLVWITIPGWFFEDCNEHPAAFRRALQVLHAIQAMKPRKTAAFLVAVLIKMFLFGPNVSLGGSKSSLRFE